MDNLRICRRRSSALLSLTGAVTLAHLLAAPAIAGEAQAEAAGTISETDSAEIIVTASKRGAQRLQDVPFSIQALGEESLQQLGAQSITDYARTIAGLSFIDAGPGQTQVILRGVSTGPTSDIGTESTVGVYVDEIPVSEATGQIDPALFDIERVEVLRGPQGTLYGSGSMGGTLRIITNKPTSDAFLLKGEGTLSDTRYGGMNYAANAAVNVPVATSAAVRAVGYYQRNSGFIDNVGLNDDNANYERTYGGRISALLEPTDRLSILATALVQDTVLGGDQTIDVPLGGFRQNRIFRERFDDELRIYNATANFAVIDGVNLVSSTSYLERDRLGVSDFSPFFGPFLASAFGLPAGSSIPTVSPLGYQLESFSQEIRLSSDTGGPFQWLIGGFYNDRKDTYDQSIDGTGVGALLGAPNDNLFLGHTDNKLKQYAVFGEASIEFLDGLTATAGLRYFDAERNAVGTKTGLIAGGNVVDTESQQANRVNPKFNLSYEPNDDVLVYAQAAKGFRVGGVNLGIPPSPTGEVTPSSFGPDSLWNYEVGLKSTLLDKTLTFNIAAFYIDWTDIQIFLNRSDGFGFFDNAGKAESKGVELEMAARPSDRVEVTFAGTYNRAKLTTDQPSINAERGDQVPYVPKWSASTSAQYRLPLGAYDSYIRADLQYVGESRVAFDPAATPVGGYVLVNTRVGLARTDLFDIALFANNLFDVRPELSASSILGPRIVPGRPRTVGITVRAGF